MPGRRLRAPDGTFVVVWESFGSSGSDIWPSSIQARLYRSDGAPLGEQFQVNSYTPNAQLDPAVAVDAQGAFVVAWESFASGGPTDVDVRDHVTERPGDSGRAAPDEVAHVPVTFDLSWRPFHDDGSMSEGATTWGYLVVRSSADSPWRIADQGVG